MTAPAHALTCSPHKLPLMPDRPRKSLMRSLGEFFGHIAHGFRADVRADRHVVKHEVEERTEDTARGTVTLRRTTIEEVEVDPPRDER